MSVQEHNYRGLSDSAKMSRPGRYVSRNAQVIAALLAGASIVGLTPVAFAQQAAADAQTADAADTAGELIVVTAQRREENIQRVPVAVTVLSPLTFEKSGGFNPIDLGRAAVGVQTVSYNGDRTNVVFSIRGQTLTTGTTFPAVQPYYAEVPLTKLYVGSFFDLENVQVLRGPQGTLFGRVTDGGNILIQPARPTNDFKGYVEARVGNYDLRVLTGMLNVPLVDDKVLIRGAFEVNRRDGFTRNVFDGRRLDDQHYESGRLSLILRPTEGFENYTTINYTHGNENGGSSQIFVVNPAAFTSPTLLAQMQAALAQQQQLGPRATSNDTNVFEKRKQVVAVNRTTLEASDNLTAKLIFGYIWQKQQSAQDYDGTGIPLQNITRSQLAPAETYVEQISGEFQLQGKLFDNRLNWTAGIWMDQQTVPGLAEAETVASSVAGVTRRVAISYPKTSSRAFYGQLDYDASDIIAGVTLHAGVRQTHDSVVARAAVYAARGATTPPPSAVPHGVCLTTPPAGFTLVTFVPCQTFGAAFNQTTWSFGVDAQLTNSLFTYAKISKGYRPGGYNTNNAGSFFSPENVISKEVGIKFFSDIAGVPVRLNMAGFYDDFTDVQRLQTLVAPNFGGAVGATVNSRSATVKGLEFEGTVTPVTGLNMSVRWSHLIGKYDVGKYTAAEIAGACPANPATQAVTRFDLFCPLNPFGRVPRDTLGVNARYTFNLGDSKASFGGDFFHTAKQWITPTGYLVPEALIPGYEVVNIDAGIDNVGGLPVDLSFFVTNLFDKTYISTVSAVSNRGSLGFSQYSFGAPRMYGMSVKVRFGS